MNIFYEIEVRLTIMKQKKNNNKQKKLAFNGLVELYNQKF